MLIEQWRDDAVVHQDGDPRPDVALVELRLEGAGRRA